MGLNSLRSLRALRESLAQADSWMRLTIKVA
jgi:hypothetical protein